MLKQDTTPRLALVVPDQKPLFSPEFVRFMKNTAYETLRAYLEKAQAKPEALQLLDDLVLTSGWEDMQDGKNVSWVENQSAMEALGAMSYNIIELGGGSLLKI